MRSLCLLLSALLPTIAARHEPSSIAIPRFASRSRVIAAFGNPKSFTDKLIPATEPGVMLKVPKFDALFDEICKVSPLAKQAITEDNPGGINSVNNTADVYKWKNIDSNPNRLISRIDKIDNFQNKGVPLIRFRSTLQGPAKQRVLCFSELVSTADLRQKWDATNAIIDTIYSAADTKEVEDLQGNAYGEASLFGIGYCKTKQSVVSPREQLTLAGLQNFPSGAGIIWGIELPNDQDHLFPENQPKRMPRSTTHLFSTTIIPKGDDTFDVEYVLQLEVGGFPGWLTGPVVIDTVKKMFRFAEGYCKSGLDGGDLAKRLDLFSDEEEVADSESLRQLNETSVLDQKQTLLMPP